MEKKHTIVHFLTAIALVILAINLFKVASGETSVVWVKQPDGAYTQDGLLSLVIPFTIIILCLAGLIVILNEGEFLEWLPAAGVIVGIMFFTTLFGFSLLGVVVVGGLYFIWWAIATFKSLKYAFFEDDYWESKLMSACRIPIVVFLALFVIAYGSFPAGAIREFDITPYVSICNWAAIVALIAAVCTVVEAIMWIRYCEY